MNLITDRPAEDVLQGTPKGKYTTEDLNRVEQAVAELYALAKELDIYTVGTIKTDWNPTALFSPESWPTQSQMQRYLANITHLCKALELAYGLPATMENLTIDGANNIEKALLQAYSRIENALQIFCYSGEVFAGEEIL